MPGYECVYKIRAIYALPANDILGWNEDATVARLPAANAARKAVELGFSA